MERLPLADDKARGFTLIEVIMAIVVVSIIAVGIGTLLFQGTRSFEEMDTRRELTGQGRLAIERMTREIRLVRCVPSGNSCVPSAAEITAMTSTEMRFVKEGYEGRGLRYDAGTQTLYLRQGQAAGDPEDILARNLSSFALSYLKNNGATATQASEVWVINIAMTLANGTESMDFRASVHPRHFY